MSERLALSIRALGTQDQRAICALWLGPTPAGSAGNPRRGREWRRLASEKERRNSSEPAQCVALYSLRSTFRYGSASSDRRVLRILITASRQQCTLLRGKRCAWGAAYAGRLLTALRSRVGGAA